MIRSGEQKYGKVGWKKSNCASFNYVMRVETMQRDAELFFSDHYPEVTHLPLANSISAAVTAAALSRHVITTKHLIAFSQLSDRLLDRLFKRYAHDFNFYGYDFLRNRHETVCEAKLKNGKKCC